MLTTVGFGLIKYECIMPPNFKTNIHVANLPVRLHIKLENIQGQGIETMPNIFTQPIYLNGGETTMLFGEDLEPYFKIDNLVFKGYSKEQYRRTGQLPEGFYQLTVEIRHYTTNRLISNQGTAMGWFALGKPPLLLLPKTAAELGEIPGTPIVFSWEKPLTGVPIGSLQYTFELWELRLQGIPEQTIAQSMPPIYSTTQTQSTLVMYPDIIPLEQGMRYAWRVTASDAFEQIPFEQNGHSEVRTFTYQCNCDTITNLEANISGSNNATFCRTPKYTHTNAKIYVQSQCLFRKAGISVRRRETK
jgi:hypothetical protein